MRRLPIKESVRLVSPNNWATIAAASFIMGMASAGLKEATSHHVNRLGTEKTGHVYDLPALPYEHSGAPNVIIASKAGNLAIKGLLSTSSE
jgi:hypothetical protein